MVSERALSVLHKGQYLEIALSSLYHILTHVWQPMTDLQHQAKITGGSDIPWNTPCWKNGIHFCSLHKNYVLHIYTRACAGVWRVLPCTHGTRPSHALSRSNLHFPIPCWNKVFLQMWQPRLCKSVVFFSCLHESHDLSHVQFECSSICMHCHVVFSQ